MGNSFDLLLYTLVCNFITKFNCKTVMFLDLTVGRKFFFYQRMPNDYPKLWIIYFFSIMVSQLFATQPSMFHILTSYGQSCVNCCIQQSRPMHYGFFSWYISEVNSYLGDMKIMMGMLCEFSSDIFSGVCV